MLEDLLEIERNAFLWINGTHTLFLDVLLWPFAGVLIWCPLLFVPLYFVWKRKRDWILAVVSCVLTSVLCTVISNNVCKPIFARFRPTTHPSFMDAVTLVNDYTADGLYGFISGHTTNAFGFAIISLLLVRNKMYTAFILLWAVLMAYSRIYFGAHFISDVIGGLIVGTSLAILVYLLYRYISKRFLGINEKNSLI